MQSKITHILIILFAMSFVMCYAEGGKKSKQRSVFGEPSFTHFNINNISTFIYNNGESDLNIYDNSGFYYPKGSYKAIFFESGLLWGGKVNGEIRVGGSAFSSGLTPGKILPDGKAENSDNPNVRIYRVRPDYLEGDLISEINDGEGAEEQIREQYSVDWTEWPADDGAPFEDKNGDGIYNSEIDIPGIPGAGQTVWYVANDLDSNLTKNLYGSVSLGIEMQATFWGYNLPTAVGNMMFRKYVLINKGRNRIDDMYISMWSDPDLGDAGDDYTGCDTLLNLGYVYNSNDNDAIYKSTLPAGGFQLLQGPVIDGNINDVARFNGRQITGKQNLNMTSFIPLLKFSSDYGEPSQANYENGSLLLYKYFQGISRIGECFEIPDELGGGCTKFPASGNPITGQGFIQEMITGASDKRMLICSGPFTMMPGDTQEVVFAQIVAGAFEGCSRLGAIGLLKHYAQHAKYVYENRLNMPKNFPAPEITSTSYDREVILTWGNDREINSTIENYSYGGYEFQGYKVYQFESDDVTIDDGILLATYDKADGMKNVSMDGVDYVTGLPIITIEALGNDSGIERHLQITNDIFNNAPLNDGTNYFFGVTAYYLLKKGADVFDYWETKPEIIRVMPQGIIPGVRYEGIYDNVLPANHMEGIGEGNVKIKVADPAMLTGHDYKITFSNNSVNDNSWNLIDLYNGEIVLNNIVLKMNDNDAVLYNGMSITISNPPINFTGDLEGDGIVESSYDGVEHELWTYNPDYGRRYSEYKVWHSINDSDNPDKYYISSGNRNLDDVIEFLEYGIPRDFELRFTESGGYGVYAFEDNKIAKVPFELWDIGINSPGDPSDDRRMIPFLLSNDDSTKSFWGWATGIDNSSYYAYPSSDRIFWADAEDNSYGTAGYNKFANHCELSGGAGAIYDLSIDTSTDGYFANLYNDSIFPISDITICDYDKDGNYPPATTVIRFITTKPFTRDDIFTFNSPGVIKDPELEKEDMDLINVFPNPYYANNPNEIGKYQNYVMFNHLPKHAKFRIFNLAGHLVRTLEKDDDSQFYLWDLQNEHRLQAPSGLYIIYIELPDLGKVKILKLAIVQERIVPDNF